MIFPMQPEFQKAFNYLIHIIKDTGPSLIAFSGGVDSTLLLYAAKHALGENVMAITVAAPYVPEQEMKAARDVSVMLQTPHKVIQLPFPSVMRDNPRDRCYTCKKLLFDRIWKVARKHGFDAVLEGTNTDDLKDYRPGIRALQELGVSSPLLMAGLNKQTIRSLARELNLPTWNKRAFSCLLTRIPFGNRVSMELLAQIEQAEALLVNLGFQEVRVRTHGTRASIEVEPERVQECVNRIADHGIAEQFNALGYTHVGVDPEGYRMGHLNTDSGDTSGNTFCHNGEDPHEDRAREYNGKQV